MWSDSSWLKSYKILYIARGLGDQHIRGVQGSAEMPPRPGKPGARSQPVCEAVQEVAPPHARPRSRSARIGSFCDLVASRSQTQAWVGAVGRVRNASPIPETLPFLNCGFRPGNSRSFDYVVSLVQSKSPAEDADHVAFSDNSLLGRCRRYRKEACRF